MQKYRPYLIAAMLAILVTIFIAPEMHEGNAMAPTLKEGDVIILLKETYSENRGMPEKGELVVLAKGTFGDQYEEDSPMRIVSGLPGDIVKMEDGSSIKVEKDQVFVTCIDPAKGIDSRKMDVGPIESKQIRGKAAFRIWPFDSIGGLEE